jgi:hypothetical protein
MATKICALLATLVVITGCTSTSWQNETKPADQFSVDQGTCKNRFSKTIEAKLSGAYSADGGFSERAKYVAECLADMGWVKP